MNVPPAEFWQGDFYGIMRLSITFFMYLDGFSYNLTRLERKQDFCVIFSRFLRRMHSFACKEWGMMIQ